MTYPVTQEWSERFGLAHVPLFEVGEIGDPDQHAVLLDGGDGSFILSVGAEACDPQVAASWAWSSGLLHHVMVLEKTVLVTRWDSAQARDEFTLNSVSQRLDAFYSYLNRRRVSGRRDVVATLLDLFRAVRGEVEVAGASDDVTVVEFLDVLA